MTDITELIDRYFATWNEADDDRRAELCAQVWTEEGRYIDPLADATGPAGIAAMIGGLRAQFPDHSLRRSTVVDSHHDLARFGWELVGPDGSLAVAGIDVAGVDLSGTRLVSITGFLGDVEPVAA
jgi:hypothetical protein